MVRSFKIFWAVFVCCMVLLTIAQTSEHQFKERGPWQLDVLGSADLSHVSRLDAAELDSFIAVTMSDYNIPGMAACAVKDGQIIWTGAYGYANIEENIEVQDSTLFMLASVSKTVTGVALMQLWEEGLFGLDDDINDHLPFEVVHADYPDSTITYRMLLTHTSGINDNWAVLSPLYVLGDSPIPLGEFLEGYLTPEGAYYDADANFNDWPPGEQFAYCNVAVALVGYLVEVISSTPFDQYCDSNIFTPLGMDQTAWFLADIDTSNVAMPYHWNGDTYIPYGHYGFPDYPDGQLRSSTAELVRFLLAFMQGGQIDGVTILESTTVDTMTTVQYPNIDPDQGLIWYRIFSPTLNEWCWGHTGADDGVTTLIGYCLEETENMGMIVLSNGNTTAGHNLIYSAIQLYAHDYLCTMTLDITLLNPTTARLSWNPVTGATQYNLYRSTTPYFPPAPFPWQSVAAPTVYFDFTDGIGDATTDYYFMGRAESAANVSSDSNIVGENDFNVDIP